MATPARNMTDADELPLDVCGALADPHGPKQENSSDQDGARGIIVIFFAGTIESCNVSFLQILGLESGGRTRIRLSALDPEKEVAIPFITTLQQELAGGEVAQGQVALRGPECREPVAVLYQASQLCKADTGTERFTDGAVSRSAALLVETPRNSAVDQTSGLSRFVKDSPFPILRISLDGMRLSANWLPLARWKTDVDSPAPPQWQEAIEEAASRKNAYEAEVQIGLKILLVVFMPVADKGRVTAFGPDISGCKQVETRLQLDAELLARASEAVVITDRDRRILDGNRTFTSIAGYTREEILGENISAYPDAETGLRHGNRDGLWEDGVCAPVPEARAHGKYVDRRIPVRPGEAPENRGNRDPTVDRQRRRQVLLPRVSGAADHRPPEDRQGFPSGSARGLPRHGHRLCHHRHGQKPEPRVSGWGRGNGDPSRAVEKERMRDAPRILREPSPPPAKPRRPSGAGKRTANE